jgi:hypothetical protein
MDYDDGGQVIWVYDFPARPPPAAPQPTPAPDSFAADLDRMLAGFLRPSPGDLAHWRDVIAGHAVEEVEGRGVHLVSSIPGVYASDEHRHFGRGKIAWAVARWPGSTAMTRRNKLEYVCSSVGYVA